MSHVGTQIHTNAIRCTMLFQNFNWGKKVDRMCAKVQWDIMILLVVQGELGIVNPKFQVKTLFEKLAMQGLTLKKDPWKTLLLRQT